MIISVAKREYLTEIEVRKFTLKTIKSYLNNLSAKDGAKRRNCFPPCA